MGWRPRDDEAKNEFTGEMSEGDKTKLERDQDARRVPTKIVALEEAAAGS